MPELLVLPPEWIDAAPTLAESSIRIDAPASDVWAHIVDHEAWPTWFTALKRVERVGTGEGIGSGRRVSVGLITLHEEFTAWDVDEHFAFAITRSPVVILKALIESVRLEPSDDGGCTVNYRQGLQGRRGCGWLVERVGTQLQRQTTEALDNLKRLVERG